VVLLPGRAMHCRWVGCVGGWADSWVGVSALLSKQRMQVGSLLYRLLSAAADRAGCRQALRAFLMTG